ncbi:carboxymuconolactone decarboxylase family protein [Phyllobacterium brassicacearum]|uniref:Carboxymuconolactone decarboxylase family protein n=1 Tax=Phyllobacterium brassicacearum TaxID=314235 RepID=A0A2P7B420_9HYPH|nr:carboxymuconolactone decarboxylase family protein [Phyllobacterium brassicacearum]PSH61198.1 carboxymuconolactone decarboxylase family protein [Phyllobacterium brassicacearum]TDQ12888.1 AhpD family alkylhydroperoxidase [Phyllobacterium brassicacearum]
MFKISLPKTVLIITAGICALSMTTPVSAEDAAAQAAYKDIEKTLGSVPTMFKILPETAVAGAWAEIKSVQLNPETQLDGKTKELIGLAVASQIPCQYCIYFHTAASKANGATDEQVREAVAMSSIVRHWSTMLNGMQVDLATFKDETDALMKHAAAAKK